MKKFESVEALLNAAAIQNSNAETARQAAHDQWGNCLKPIGSLGVMESDLEDIAALIGTADIDLSHRAVVVFCSDNGVLAQGVASCGPEITTVLADAMSRRESCVCTMAKLAHCDVVPVDMGILDYSPDGVTVLDRRMGNGTADLTMGPAMTRTQAENAILAGADLVREQAEKGVKLLATGELGMGNTTTAAAVACVLLDQKPGAITGRGAGLTDDGLKRKIAAIEKGLRVNAPDASDPIDVIAKVGGFDIAGMCGMFLGCAAYKVPVLADGLISTVAALCALRLCPESADAILASHVSAEPAGQLVMKALNKRPLITAGLRLGEGTGAVAAMPLLDMALAVYNGTTFHEAGMDPCSGEGF